MQPLLRATSATITEHLAKLGLPASAHARVEIPPDRTLGDLAANYPLVVAKQLGQPPMAIAEQLAASLRTDPRYSEVVVAAPGYVNLRLAPATAAGLVEELAREPLDAPTRALLAGRRVIVELGSENVAKPMSVGHLRSNIIGMAIARLQRACGAEVTTIDHLGDWGTQFGKLIVAYRAWGDEARVAAGGIAELVALYERFHVEVEAHPELEDQARAVFQQLEAGDPEVRALWQRFVDLSLGEYESIKHRLNVQTDHVMGESFYEGKMQPIIDELLAKGVATQNADGSIAVEFPKADKLPSCLVQKSNGSTLYHTRDLAALQYRMQRFQPDAIAYVVGEDQLLHFRQLFRIAQLLGWQFHAEHVHFGFIFGESGEKMSTRKGTAITLRTLLERSEAEALRVLQERGSEVPESEWPQVARDLATAAVMYNDLSQNRTTQIVFNWAQMLAFDGDTAPYLLYTVARINALEAKAAAAGVSPGPVDLRQPLEQHLALALLALHDRVALAAETLKPNLVAEQLHRIAQAFNGFYAELPILGDDAARSGSRLALALVTRKLLRGGLDLLGLPHVDRM